MWQSTEPNQITSPHLIMQTS